MPSAQAAPLIVIGHPGDRRTAGIQQARSRLGMAPAIQIPYAGLLQGRPLAALLEAAVLAPDSGAVLPLLRLESPGGGFATERALIALGAPDTPDADDSLHPFGGQPDPRPCS